MSNAADCRRATSLVIHYGRQDVDGVNAVIREAADVDRVTLLIANVVDLHHQIVPVLLTPDGIACLSQLVYALSEDQDADEDCRRAARLVIAHSLRDLDAVTAVLTEARNADRVTEILLAVMSTYRSYVPQLYSDVGLSVLQRSVIDFAAREDQELADE